MATVDLVRFLCWLHVISRTQLRYIDWLFFIANFIAFFLKKAIVLATEMNPGINYKFGKMHLLNEEILNITVLVIYLKIKWVLVFGFACFFFFWDNYEKGFILVPIKTKTQLFFVYLISNENKQLHDKFEIKVWK